MPAERPDRGFARAQAGSTPRAWKCSAPGTTRLFHAAIRYPDRASLADVLRPLLAADIPLEGATDHGVSEALYLRDPDGNGIELYRDRPPEQWPRDDRGASR